MRTIGDLIDEHGDIDHIPSSELVKIGWLRHNGDVFKVNSDDEIIINEENGYGDYYEEGGEDREYTIESLREDLINEAHGKYSEDKMIPKKYLDSIVNRAVEETLTRNRQLVEAINSGYVSPVDVHIDDETLKESEQETIKLNGQDIRHNVLSGKFSAELDNAKEEFEQKYGPISIAGKAPFISYAFRKIVFEEEDPKEFWGMDLFTNRAKLISKFSEVEGIEYFSDIVYSSGVDYSSEIIFGEGSGSLQGLENILNGLPRSVEEFEYGVEDGRGVVESYLLAEHNWLEDNDINGEENESFRRILTDIYKTEFAEEVAEIERKYEFLDASVRSEGKRHKIKRLAGHNDHFIDLVRARVEGRLDSYLNSLTENKETSQDLENMGVNTTIFYSGIPEIDFALSDEGKVLRSDLVKENMGVYRTSLENLLSNNVLNAPNKLVQKIYDGVKNDDSKKLNDEERKSYILDVNKEEDLMKICRIASEYASRKNNVKDSQVAGASAHHLNSVSKFLRRDSGNGDSKDRSYSVRIARKDPLTDVDIGNDGGCCIGIYGDGYDSDEITIGGFLDSLKNGTYGRVGANGCYMPFYLKDRATQFAEIYRGGDRVGMALMFAGKNEDNEPVLAINSIEMSDKLRKDNNRQRVINETMGYIEEYSLKSGFKHLLIGDHSFNPANYASGKHIEFSHFEKIDNWNEEYYADIDLDGSTSQYSLVY
jgi:hypothetical protein